MNEKLLYHFRILKTVIVYAHTPRRTTHIVFLFFNYSMLLLDQKKERKPITIFLF